MHIQNSDHAHKNALQIRSRLSSYKKQITLGKISLNKYEI